MIKTIEIKISQKKEIPSGVYIPLFFGDNFIGIKFPNSDKYIDIQYFYDGKSLEYRLFEEIIKTNPVKITLTSITNYLSSYLVGYREANGKMTFLPLTPYARGKQQDTINITSGFSLTRFSMIAVTNNSLNKEYSFKLTYE